MRILDISQNISCQDVVGFVHSGEKLALPHEAISRLENVRNYLDQKSTENGAPIYGVNTGFGSLCDTVIAPDDLSTLQKNLLLSHAC
ncbi:MAG: aromatic amino acid lyase, partial [Flavobacteriales bacterium]